MKLQTDCAKWSQDSDGVWVSFRINNRYDAVKVAEEVQGKTFNIEVRERKKKRSLDANAYAWVLLDKLAVAIGEPRVEVYKSFVREIGGNSEIVCVQDHAVHKMRKAWENNGIGWPTDASPSKLEGCTNVTLFYGSSTYDVSQMRRLINLIVDECKAHGIETMSPDELCKLKGLLDG